MTAARAAARALLNARQFGAAQRVCEAALAQDDSLELRFLLASSLYQQGRHATALPFLDQCLAIDPSRLDVRFARASTLAAIGCKREAADDLKACLDAAPDSPDVATTLAGLRVELGEPDAAMALYDHALQVEPMHFAARLNRGTLLLNRQRPLEALEEFDTLVANSPLPSVHVNRAQALFALFRDEEALAAADAALAIDPRYVLAAVNRANALAALGRLAESEEQFRRARGIDAAQFTRIVEEPAYGGWKESPPDPRSIATLRAVQLQQLCDWRRRDEAIARVRDLPGHLLGSLLSHRHMAIAFDALALPLSAAEQLAVEGHVGRAFPAQPAERARRHPDERIRVGFLSPDFRPHPMAWLARLLLRRMDRSRFEVVAYPLNPHTGDPVRASLLAEADRSIDVSALSDKDAAARIAADAIDVLVECGGYCEGARPAILALRPAPVQASYLGMPGTLGMDCVDYRISDLYCTPPEQQRHWTEKLVLLPETHLVYDPPGETGAPPSRASLGLPEDGFVYCCMGNPLKIEPTVFSAWMRILREVPRSVLWLYAAKPQARGNLRAAAQAAGIDPSRLVFADHAPRPRFVAATSRADLFVDTLHFGSHTTAMDALWAGVPVLSCPGETMASRLAGSLMHAARLPEFVARDLEDYVAIAVRMARQPAELAALKQRLREARTSAPVFDVPARVKAFEDAVAAMHRRRLADLPPDTLAWQPDYAGFFTIR